MTGDSETISDEGKHRFLAEIERPMRYNATNGYGYTLGCGESQALLAELDRLRASLAAATEAAASAEPLAEVRELWQRASEREGNLASAVADVVWKATPYGTTENDDVYAYLVPKGAMHRLVGVAQSNGAHVPVAFRALGAAGGSGVTP